MKTLAIIFLFTLPFGHVHADEKEKSKTQVAQITIAEVSKAADIYYTDCAEYPVDLKHLVVPPPTCGNWGPDPYIREIPLDPWGHPLRYKRIDSSNYEIRSLGADGIEGGEDEDADINGT